MQRHRSANDELALIRAEIRRLKTREALLRAGATAPDPEAARKGGLFSEWGPVRSVLEDAGFWAERQDGPVTLEAERERDEAGTVQYRVAS